MADLKKQFNVEGEFVGERLDNYLAKAMDISRSAVTKIIKYDGCTINGKKAKAGAIVKLDDLILVTIRDKETSIEAEDIPIEILYEDSDIAVINKKQGMTVHPGGGVYTGTLANALLYKYKSLSEFGTSDRPGIVHRLDKDTSGVMVIALNDKAHKSLSDQIANREVTKIYHAILEGNLAKNDGEIKTQIDRSNNDRKKMAVVNRDGKLAITRYKLIQNFEKNCYVEFNILTGRTHQIRVHAKHIGNPVVGDSTYGYRKQRFDLSGQLLHAYSLAFTHPTTKKKVMFEAPLPEHFTRILDLLQVDDSENEEE